MTPKEPINTEGITPEEADKILERLFSNIEQLGIAVGFEDLRPIHGDWIREMVLGKEDFTLQAHRASYKSSCLAIAIAIRMIVYPTENIIFLRKADNDVSEMLRMVSKILGQQAMADLAYMFHHEELYLTEEAQDHLSTNLWTSPMGAPQLLGLGLKSSITGKHAAVVITDDICNLLDRTSKAERETTKLHYMELQNIRNRGGRIINLGTPWHKDDVFTLMPNIHRYDCYSTGLITPEELQTLRQSMSPSLFAANYELQHIASSEALFVTPPRFTEKTRLIRDGIAHIDAAYGGGDYTAFTCGKRRDDTIYLYGRLWHTHVDNVLPIIIEESKRLMCQPVYCEDNGDQGFLRRELMRQDCFSRSYTETENKYIKIATHLRKWWPNIVFLEGTDREYINQIMDYTMQAEHDDAPDSAACVCRHYEKRRC